MPKQLLDLVGGRSLLAQTVDRLHGLIPADRIFVITNRDLVDACRAAVPELPPENVVGEPVGRDTAAAVALGAALVKMRDPRGVFCILPADHVLGDLESFRTTLGEAMGLAGREDVLITIGIPPAAPVTGYGYIETGESLGGIFLKARRFVEKPSLDKAQEYLAGGRHFWNSGMFIWSLRAIENAFRRHRPVLAEMLQTLAASRDLDADIEAEYPTLDKISIDYAVMEKAPNIVMARGAFAWDDVGSWTALENHIPKDEDGNVAIGPCAQMECGGNIIYSKDRLTALIGVRNMIVVQSEGVTLVCARDRAQDIKKVVERLRSDGRFDEVL
jgi:mannose-1-phosphate guanylyltransferase